MLVFVIVLSAREVVRHAHRHLYRKNISTCFIKSAKRGQRECNVLLTADRDRQRFLETLTEACQKTGWQAHAFCLMSNHFHLVVEPPQPNLTIWCWSGVYIGHRRRGPRAGRLEGGPPASWPRPRPTSRAVTRAGEHQRVIWGLGVQVRAQGIREALVQPEPGQAVALQGQRHA
ncbi:MAG: transposase [Limisphaerales bacterium]